MVSSVDVWHDLAHTFDSIPRLHSNRKQNVEPTLEYSPDARVDGQPWELSGGTPGSEQIFLTACRTAATAEGIPDGPEAGQLWLDRVRASFEAGGGQLSEGWQHSNTRYAEGPIRPEDVPPGPEWQHYGVRQRHEYVSLYVPNSIDELVAYCKRKVAVIASGIDRSLGEQDPVVSGAATPPRTQPSTEQPSIGRSPRERVEAYLDFVWDKTGERCNKKDFWGVAGYTDPGQFEDWQGGRGNPGLAAKFGKVMTLEPQEFVKRAKGRRPE